MFINIIQFPSNDDRFGVFIIKMKVLRIIPELDFGGLEQRVRLTLLAFRSIPDVNLKVVVLGRGGRVSDELRREGLNPLVLQRNIKIPNVPLIYRLYRIIKSFRPDVVHCSAAEANFHGLIAAWIGKVPLRIGEEIGFPDHGLFWKYVFKTVYSIAHKVIAISNPVSRKLTEWGEIREEKIQVIFNPVKIFGTYDDFPTNKEQDPFVFIITCRLVPVKNMKMLIAVFAELVNHYSNRRLFLHIVGDGPERTELKALSRALGVENAVQFKGYQEDVSPYLMKADAFVLPSFSEGFSISMVEAMLCSLPCIITKNGGPSEVIKDEKTGFLIDPHNQEGLLKAMERIIVMKDEDRAAMGKLARIDAERFSLDNYVCELRKLYAS